MKTVNIHEAKTQLSRLIEDVAAGEEVIIARNGKPVARLLPFAPPARAVPGNGVGRCGSAATSTHRCHRRSPPSSAPRNESAPRYPRVAVVDGGWALGDRAREAIADAANGVWVSAASIWEITIKAGVGRLELPGPVAEVLPPVLADNDFSPLPITVEHALTVSTLPPVHADPFDRILIAQAMSQSWTLVTADAVFARYPVHILPADPRCE